MEQHGHWGIRSPPGFRIDHLSRMANTWSKRAVRLHTLLYCRILCTSEPLNNYSRSLYSTPVPWTSCALQVPVCLAFLAPRFRYRRACRVRPSQVSGESFNMYSPVVPYPLLLFSYYFLLIPTNLCCPLTQLPLSPPPHTAETPKVSHLTCAAKDMSPILMGCKGYCESSCLQQCPEDVILYQTSFKKKLAAQSTCSIWPLLPRSQPLPSYRLMMII